MGSEGVGGTERPSLLLVLWSVMICTVTAWMLTIPFTPRYLEAVGVTEQAELALYTGLAAAFTNVGMLAGALGWGVASDRWPKRTVFLAAIVASLLAYVGYALVSGPIPLVLVRFVIGACATTMLTASAVLLDETRPAQIPRALGILTSAVFVGNAVGPPAAGMLVNTWGARVGIIGALVCQIVAFGIAVGGFAKLGAVAHGVRPPTGATKLSRREGLLRAAIPIAGLVLLNAASAIYQTFLPVGLRVVQPQWVWVLTGWALGLYGLAAAAGSILSNRIAARWGVRVFVVGFAAALAVAFALMVVMHDVVPVLVIAALVGLLVGAVSPLLLSRVLSWSIGTAAGFASGIAMASQSLGGAAGTIGGGWLASSVGTFHVYGLAALIAVMLGGVGLLLRREPPTG